ncbi:hypothetical protein QK908_11960 [Lactococcus cremoris]
MAALEQEITAMNDSWTGSLPDEIPMVPDDLDVKTFDNYISEETGNVLYFGLNKASSEPEIFDFSREKH